MIDFNEIEHIEDKLLSELTTQKSMDVLSELIEQYIVMVNIIKTDLFSYHKEEINQNEDRAIKLLKSIFAIDQE